MAKSEIAPHVCPQCGSPCYQGAFALECTGQKCDHYHAETAAAYRREQFPGVDSIEDEDTQPNARETVGGRIPVSGPRWPSIAPAAVFPDTDAELVQQVKDGVADAKKNATPAEAKALDDWLKEILEQYVTAYGEKYIPIRVQVNPSRNDPRRLDIKIELTRIVPVVHAEPITINWGNDELRNPIFLDDDQQGKLDAAIQAHSRELRNWWANAPSPTAKGEQLDRMADLMGGDEADLMVVRAPGETDEEMRARLRKRWGQFGPGASL